MGTQKELTCEICGETFDTHRELEEHGLADHQNPTYEE